MLATGNSVIAAIERIKVLQPRSIKFVCLLTCPEGDVLMRFEDYHRLTRQRRNIADALAMPGMADIEFEPPRVTIDIRPADFS